MNKRTYSILGDSISTFEGFIPKNNDVFYPRKGYDIVSPEQTWWKIVEKALDLALVTNDSYSGSRVTQTGLKPKSSAFCQRAKGVKGSLIFLFGGTNDFNHSAGFLPSLETFKASYKMTVETLRANNPDSLIVCILPLQRLDKGIREANSKGWSLWDMKTVIEDLAMSFEHVKTVDLTSIEVTKENGVLCDHVHPSVKGMALIADTVLKTLEAEDVK